MSKFVILTCITCFASTFSIWAESVIWPDFYEVSSSSDAQKTSLDSRDAQMLKKAGLYYFSLAHGAFGTRIDEKNQIENAQKAVDYFEAAYKIERRNPVIATWTATSNLALAGISRKLTHKIRYANRGIGLFESIKQSTYDNLNYLSMRAISFSAVPKNFRNLTAEVVETGEKYIDILSRKKNELPQEELDIAINLEQAVYVSMAKAEYNRKNKDEAKTYLMQVDKSLLLLGNSEGSTSADQYLFLKKKLKI